jgi:DNA-directed RNA polymerase specialized sigma24 family protein
MDNTDHTSDKRALADALACLADATRVHVVRALTSGPGLVLRARAAECYGIPAAIVLPIHAVLRDGWMTCPRDQRPALGRVIHRVLDGGAWGPALQQALGRVVALAHAGCLDLAAQLLCRKEDAEDAVSEFELRLPRLAIWFDPAVADPWPWLRTAVRWQCHNAWRRQAREGYRTGIDLDEIIDPVTLEADDPTEEADPSGPSFDEVLRAAVTGARQDARASLPRYVAMWRDHEIARDQGIMDLGALARHYFGKDTKQNRNRVSQCCKRVRVRLEHAARHSGTANVPVETVEVLDDAPAGNALGTRRRRC